MATFQLDKDEETRFSEWNEIHLKNHHGGKEPYGGAIGGRLRWTFSPTTIGTITKVTCTMCLKHHENVHTADLTDYDLW